MNGLNVHLVTTMKNKGKTSEEKKLGYECIMTRFGIISNIILTKNSRFNNNLMEEICWCN
jgi:hypothetical protein